MKTTIAAILLTLASLSLLALAMTGELDLVYAQITGCAALLAIGHKLDQLSERK